MRQDRGQVDAPASDLLDSPAHLSEFRIEDVPEARHHEMRLPELGDALALPALPCFPRLVRGPIRVLVEDGDAIAVLCEQHCRREAHRARSDDDHLGHLSPILPVAGRRC